MKIGIVCYASFGGSGVVATELGIGLAERGHEIHFITTGHPFRLSEKKDANISVHVVEEKSYYVFKAPPYTMLIANEIIRIIREKKLDLLHVHYAIPHASSAILARNILHRPELPIVTTLHGTDVTLVGHQEEFLEVTRYSLRESTALTAVSKFLAEETRCRFGRDLNVRTIPNFIDTKRFTPRYRNCALRKLLGLKRGEKMLLHASNMRPLKRVPDIVAAFAAIREKLPNCKLVLIGDGPESDRIRHETCARGLCASVFFAGSHQWPEELFACADLFLLASETESFGLAALEAMSSGVPVIATRVGGIPEVVVDGETGFLGAVGDTGFMAEKSIELLSDEALYERFAKSARARAVGLFAQEKIIPRFEKLYNEFVPERR